MKILNIDENDIKNWVKGYNKAKDTYSNSDDDIISFTEWCERNYSKVNDKEDFALWSPKNGNCIWYSTLFNDEEFQDRRRQLTTKELLDIWKEQQPIKLYYE